MPQIELYKNGHHIANYTIGQLGQSTASCPLHVQQMMLTWTRDGQKNTYGVFEWRWKGGRSP